MESERWQRLKEILDEVCDLPADQRQAYLYKACRGDASMFREAQSLLDFDDDGLDGFIEEPLWSVKPQESADKNVGRRVGAYRIQRLLGRGGMGTVYLAVRQDDFDQRVALKLVNPGTYTQEILGRFLNERQILAHLEHPSIARLLDGGTTEDDLPYFVMEYVDGVPIDEHCETQKLSVHQRLELFRQVCSAVHVAHQSLVVHRDIKPSNILITSDGVPKLLDFGIAKILRPSGNGGRQQAEIADRDLETAAGHHLMTPNYASPEQILDEVITTASDVYSLGVLLYRLLSHRVPYEVTDAGYSKMLRVICNDEPTKPSSAVVQPSSVLVSVATTERRPAQSELRRLQRGLAGDLDAIVLKAMRKEPQHRYHSVEQFSDDIRSHLKGAPVLARKGTWAYLTGKFVRRYKVALAVVMLILGFAVSTTFLWRQAVEERAHAERERSRAVTVVEFLEGLFDAADPDATQGREVTVREILDRGREGIAEGLEEEVETQAYLLRTLGTIYTKLGLYDEARQLKERALQLRRKVSTGDDPELAIELANLGRLALSRGDHETAQEYYREALGIRQRAGQDPVEIALTLYNLAIALSFGGHYEEAEELQMEVLRIRARELGERDRTVASVLYALGTIKYTRGDLPAAERFLRRALSIQVEQVGAENVRVASMKGILGLILQELERHEDAERAFRQSLALQEKLLGEDHKYVAMARTRLAALLLDRAETALAGELLTLALPVLRATLSEGSWPLAEGEGVMGSYLVALGHYEEAEAYLKRGYKVSRDVKGEDAIQTRIASRRLLELYETWESRKKTPDSRELWSTETEPPSD